MLYLDYASTTPVDKDVIDTYTNITSKYYANSDSMHKLGFEVEKLQEQSRNMIANLLNVTNKNIIFTSGASESNSLALKGYAIANKSKGNHILLSSVEHSSVHNACMQLRDYFNFDVEFVNVDNNGVLDLEDLKNKIRKDTIIVTCMLVNNEVGSINDYKTISKIVKEKNNRCIFHMDAVQALCKVDIDLKYVDSASFSAHKIGGIKGSGILYKSNNLEYIPLINGGQQENGLRGGTSNSISNIVFAKTLRLALAKYKNNNIEEVFNYAFNELSKIDNIIINSNLNGVKHIINFSSKYISSEIMMNALNKNDIMCSAQSTCSSRTKSASRVLLAMNKGENLALNAIRISFSYNTTKDEIDVFIKVLKEILNKYERK